MPALCYSYCKKKRFLSNKCAEWEREVFDLMDPDTRKMLIQMEFRARSKMYNK